MRPLFTGLWSTLLPPRRSDRRDGTQAREWRAATVAYRGEVWTDARGCAVVVPAARGRRAAATARRTRCEPARALRTARCHRRARGRPVHDRHRRAAREGRLAADRTNRPGRSAHPAPRGRQAHEQDERCHNGHSPCSPRRSLDIVSWFARATYPGSERTARVRHHARRQHRRLLGAPGRRRSTDSPTTPASTPAPHTRQTESRSPSAAANRRRAPARRDLDDEAERQRQAPLTSLAAGRFSRLLPRRHQDRLQRRRAGGSTNVDIYVINVDGSDLAADHAPGPDRYPAWSPDGSKIVFESQRTGVNQVWMMNADGSDQTQLTLDPTQRIRSPNGARTERRSRTRRARGTQQRRRHLAHERRRQRPAPTHLRARTSSAPSGRPTAPRSPSSTTPPEPSSHERRRHGRHAVHPGGIQFVPGWQPRDTGADDDG